MSTSSISILFWIIIVTASFERVAVTGDELIKKDSAQNQSTTKVYPNVKHGKEIIGGATFNVTETESFEWCQSAAESMDADQWVWSSRSQECHLQYSQCGQFHQENQDYVSGHLIDEPPKDCAGIRILSPLTAGGVESLDTHATTGVGSIDKPGVYYPNGCHKKIGPNWFFFAFGSRACRN